MRDCPRPDCRPIGPSLHQRGFFAKALPRWMAMATGTVATRGNSRALSVLRSQAHVRCTSWSASKHRLLYASATTPASTSQPDCRDMTEVELV